MTHAFAFLSLEWPEVHEAAERAWLSAHPDPRAACFYARRALELAVSWAYRADSSLRRPYQDNLSSLVHEPSFKRAAGDAVFNKARLIIDLGNRAVHREGGIQPTQSIVAVRELFHVAYWFARTYGRRAKPAAGLSFDAQALPQHSPLPKQTVAQLQEQERQLAERDAQVAKLEGEKATLEAELAQLRAEIAQAKREAQREPDTHDYSEAQTRADLLDLYLREAGWPLDQERDREFPVSGMPNATGDGFVDYVFWGSDGKPLALLEAKRTQKSAQLGQQQAKLYADALERAFGQRPIILYSNGYEHWLWDDASYGPRQVQGFFRRDELERMIQRRTSRKVLAEAEVNPEIVERYYQTRAVRRICEAFEREHERKALVVMATGAGKTRTVIALCDLLIRCNWVKRVLFLADRQALVTQAVGAFKRHLPNASPVNLLSEKSTEGRVYVSTYPTMMGLIDAQQEGQRRFGVGHFDLIVIDEAHRSVYQKYGAIFAYFDALLVGLTATPRQEIDRNTYRLFDLENQVPTDAYELATAVADGYLVPSKSISVPLKFVRDGVSYDQLSESEKEQWELLDWEEDGQGAPARVEAEALNKWLFNADTVDKVLEHLMARGQKVEGGDRLGKTIIFAKTQLHAEFIAQRFNINYPHYKGEFARVVHNKVDYVQSLIDDFSERSKAPHIAISVDMLDTGVDVPEVVNLVFFKLVRSPTKFWQMVGRGTRLCPDLFAPGQDKEFFYIFDFCQNLEFFGQQREPHEGSLAAPLGKRLFTTRLDLLGELDRMAAAAGTQVSGFRDRDPNPGYGITPASIRRDVAALLQSEVAAMNPDNFLVRPKRRSVERFAAPDAWQTLDDTARQTLAGEVAGLPSALESEGEEAKRFDLLLLKLQLALLRSDAGFAKLRDQLKIIAELLEDKASIPVVRDQLRLIQELQSDAWWEGVTLGMLEHVRLRLRSLVRLIDKQKRKPVYTDFEDQLGAETQVVLPGFDFADGFERFRAKARAFLRQHENHLTIHKLRTNKPLTAADLEELEQILRNSGAKEEDVQRAKDESQGLGLFVRALVGMEREAAKQALSSFLAKRTLNASQIEFMDLIVDQLTEHGAMEPRLLYESPFVDVAPRGPNDLFDQAALNELFGLFDQVRASALAS